MRATGRQRLPVAPESIIIFCIGIADLITTLTWVHKHGAEEGNPIFRAYLAMGPVWFALAKIVLLICPIIILEVANRRRPRTGRWGSRFAIAAYVAFYVVGVFRLNPDLLRPQHKHAPSSYSLADMSQEQMEQYAATMRWMVNRERVNNRRASEQAIMNTLTSVQ